VDAPSVVVQQLYTSYDQCGLIRDCADKLSPEKRLYYERLMVFLQVISRIKIDNFSKNGFL